MRMLRLPEGIIGSAASAQHAVWRWEKFMGRRMRLRMAGQWRERFEILWPARFSFGAHTDNCRVFPESDRETEKVCLFVDLGGQILNCYPRV